VFEKRTFSRVTSSPNVLCVAYGVTGFPERAQNQSTMKIRKTETCVSPMVKGSYPAFFVRHHEVTAIHVVSAARAICGFAASWW